MSKPPKIARNWWIILWVSGFVVGMIFAFGIIRIGKGRPDDVCNIDCQARDYDGGEFNRDHQRCICFTTTSASHEELNEMMRRGYRE